MLRVGWPHHEMHLLIAFDDDDDDDEEDDRGKD